MAAIKPVLNRQAASVKILGVIKQIDPDVEEVGTTGALACMVAGTQYTLAFDSRCGRSWTLLPM